MLIILKKICPICKENKIIHPKVNIKYNKTVKIDEVKTKVEVTRETENYMVQMIISNNTNI